MIYDFNIFFGIFRGFLLEDLMLRALTFILCLLSALVSNAITLTWLDPTTGQLNRIDLNKKKYQLLMPSGYWVTQEGLVLDNVNDNEFPADLHVQAFDIGTTQLMLNINCTGQVYYFNKNKHLLERIDKTFFRGYNCWPFLFVRKGKLYSFGGYGFWHTNNIQTYYDLSKREWGSLLVDTKGPAGIYRGLNGYFRQSDEYISALNYIVSDVINAGNLQKDSYVYSYSFKSNKWQKKGVITESILKDLTDGVVTFFQSEQLFLAAKYNAPIMKIYLIDPKKNECRIWSDSSRLITGDLISMPDDRYRNFVWKDTLYIRYIMDDIKYGRHTFNKLSIQSIWNEATYIGGFYENGVHFNMS